MVKVFLEESAEACIERLVDLIEHENAPTILCPSQHFIKKLITFYPHLANQNLTTFSLLSVTLGLHAIPMEVVNIVPNLNFFADPYLQCMDYINTMAASEQALVELWLKDVPFFHSKAATVSPTESKTTCVFFGPFEPRWLDKVYQWLNPFFKKIFVIRRTFISQGNIPLQRIKSYTLRNIQHEREWIRNRSQDGTDFIVHHPENWLNLFQNKNDTQRLRWLDYQEEKTLGYFLSYGYTLNTDKEARKENIRQLQNAHRQCNREDLTSLKNWLSLQTSTKDISMDATHWPLEGSLGDFVLQLKELYKNSTISWNLPEVLESCPIKFTHRQFFDYLRRNEKHYMLDRLIPWDSALYLPIKEGCFLHGSLETPEFDIQRLSWFNEIERRGGTLTVIAPERDEKGMPCTPLIPSTPLTEAIKLTLGHTETSSSFTIPQTKLVLSCKNWERFHLSPIRTWLDAILKVKKFDLICPTAKARICGEWVHENLEFETQPKDLETWQAFIEKKAETRWQTLQSVFLGHPPIQLQQWHTWTLQLSLRIAQTCSDLLDHSWQLTSEYILPKGSKYSGRIDLLGTRSTEAIIVDFKTAVDYTFTPYQINKGHGLQLLLYGHMLKPYYEHIHLRVINGNCDNLVLELQDIVPKVCSIENWLKQIKQTGIYTEPPQESSDILPLCWR